MPVNGGSLGLLRRCVLLLSSYNVCAAARVGTSSAAATKCKGQVSANLSTCILNPKSSRGTGEERLSSPTTCGVSDWLKFPSSAIITPDPAIPAQQMRRFSSSRKHTPASTYGLYGDVQEIEREIQWFDVDTDELVELLADGDIQLFDVREPEELVETGHIPGAVNLPLGEVDTALGMFPEAFQQKYGVPKPSKEDDNIVFQCRSGVRSLSAMETAHALGYKKARHYVRGWLGWEEHLGESELE